MGILYTIFSLSFKFEMCHDKREKEIVAISFYQLEETFKRDLLLKRIPTCSMQPMADFM